jgi:5'-3' exonuclease
MGVKGLYTYLKAYRHDIYSQTLPAEPKLRLGFDAMSMLYKYKGSFEDMYPGLKELKDQGHRILFVFDGKAPAEKEAEVTARRDARQDASHQATALKEYLTTKPDIQPKERKILEYSVARLEFQGWHMTREIRHAFQKELFKMGIPYLKGVGEADDVLVDLVAAGKLDVVVSTDMDFLLSGVPRVWIPFRKSYDGFEEILLAEVLEGEAMTAASLRDAGILCGVEPLRGQVNVISQTAFSWIRYYTTIEGVLKSNIVEPQLDVLRDEAKLAAVRAHFDPKPWESRIRPDHLETCRGFLEAL